MQSAKYGFLLCATCRFSVTFLAWLQAFKSQLWSFSNTQILKLGPLFKNKVGQHKWRPYFGEKNQNYSDAQRLCSIHLQMHQDSRNIVEQVETATIVLVGAVEAMKDFITH